jgi:hypothetical protein
MGKIKKVKAKLVYFKPNIFSDKHSALFNNEKYSDITIKIGDVSYKCHKNILASSSDYFYDLADKNEIIIKEENKNMKNYIEFLYTGAIDLAKEDELYDFLNLIIKYKTKFISDIQIPSKKLLLKVIEFGEKENDKKEFETLLNCVSFKKFDEVNNILFIGLY